MNYYHNCNKNPLETTVKPLMLFPNCKTLNFIPWIWISQRTYSWIPQIVDRISRIWRTDDLLSCVDYQGILTINLRLIWCLLYCKPLKFWYLCHLGLWRVRMILWTLLCQYFYFHYTGIRNTIELCFICLFWCSFNITWILKNLVYQSITVIWTNPDY